MYPRLTRPIWQIAASAEEHASAAGENQIQPEHLLGALLSEPDGTATRLFAELGALPTDLSATLAANLALRQAPAAQPATGGAAAAPDAAGRVPALVLSPRSERAIEYAHEEAARLGHDRTGTEHLLLGLIREGERECGRTLAGHCITLERARRAVAQVKAAYAPVDADPLVGRIVTYTYDLRGRVIGVR